MPYQKAHKGLIGLIIGSQVILWGSVYVFGYIYTADAISLDQRRIIKESKLKNCVRSNDEDTPYKSLNTLNRTWLGNAVSENLQNQKALICKLPTQEDHWTTMRSSFFEQHDILGLSKDDIVNLVHESIHSIQTAPSNTRSGLWKTASYQTLIAREVSALCLSVLDAYQRSLDVNTKLWRDDKTRTFAEYSVLKILEEIVNQDKKRDEWIRQPKTRPPARIVDELIYRTLSESFPFPDYETPFYTAEREHFIWGNDINFTPLTEDELISALTGILYTKEELTETLSFLKELGEEASDAKWFIDRMEQDYLIRTNAVRERIEKENN